MALSSNTWLRRSGLLARGTPEQDHGEERCGTIHHAHESTSRIKCPVADVSSNRSCEIMKRRMPERFRSEGWCRDTAQVSQTQRVRWGETKKREGFDQAETSARLAEPGWGESGSGTRRRTVMSFAVSLGKETECEPCRCPPQGKGGSVVSNHENLLTPPKKCAVEL